MAGLRSVMERAGSTLIHSRRHRHINRSITKAQLCLIYLFIFHGCVKGGVESNEFINIAKISAIFRYVCLSFYFLID